MVRKVLQKNSYGTISSADAILFVCSFETPEGMMKYKESARRRYNHSPFLAIQRIAAKSCFALKKNYIEKRLSNTIYVLSFNVK
jgi:hypothetical protein